MLAGDLSGRGNNPVASQETVQAESMPSQVPRVLPRDAEEAQHALAEVQLLLERHAFAQETARHHAETVRQAARVVDDDIEDDAPATNEPTTQAAAAADTAMGEGTSPPVEERTDSDQLIRPSGGASASAQASDGKEAVSGNVNAVGMGPTRPSDSLPGRTEPSETAESEEGESAYLVQLRQRLANLHPADIAYILEALPPDERRLVWDSVKSEADGAVLLEVSEPVLEDLIDSMSEADLVAAVKDLDTDDVADLVEYLPPAVVEKVQHELTPAEREQLRAAMSYPEDSVGARMDFEFVRVREDVTLEVVLRYLRRFEELPQHTDQVFVVDRNGILMGSLSIEQVLINEPDTEVSAVMHRDILSLDVDDDVGEAAQAFERYDLISAPVVDPHHKLIGRLTVDEVVDVIREESEADALNQAGLQEEEDLFGSVWQSARNRWLWLAINLVTAFLASRVIGLFDGTIQKIVALATLMPIVAGLAGNSGNQTMALVIRSLAQGQITGSNFGRIMRKELTVALLNGVVWGGVAGLATWLLYHDSPSASLLGTAMGVAIILNLLVGATLGVTVPFVLTRFGRDPALGSSVLLTFSTDGLGFLIFLGLATMLF